MYIYSVMDFAKPISYRNQSFHLQYKLRDRFLFEIQYLAEMR